MSSAKSTSSIGDLVHDGRGGGGIVKMGTLKKLKKLKAMSKKFFVLRAESSDSSARLEYYESEKKWKSNQPPKRVIILKSCFNINRRLDTKHKYVIALYTKDDCFCIVLDSEEELEDWLKALLSLQQGDDVPDGEPPKPTFEHVWHVKVENKGLGTRGNILGPCLLCLTDKTLTLVKMTKDEDAAVYEFSLMNIRRCGISERFFYMEVGRSACIGPGDLWMQTEDQLIARSMHEAIWAAMKNNNVKEEQSKRPKDDWGPKPRVRASTGIQLNNSVGSDDAARSTNLSGKMSAPATYYELNSTQSLTTSTDNHQSQVCAGSLPGSFHCHHHYHHYRTTSLHPRPSQRRHSVSAMNVTASGPAHNHQRTYSFPLSEPEPPTAPSFLELRRASTGRMAAKRNAVRSSTAARDRCDSLPSRTRTTSEGQPQAVVSTGRMRHTVCHRAIPHSPPKGSSPVSPGSTDSAGSSLSIDDSECCGPSSVTPEEFVIEEENPDDNPYWVHIDPAATYSSSTGNVGIPQRKVSPNLATNGYKYGSPSQGSNFEISSPCGSSPLDHTGYLNRSPGPPSDSTPRSSIYNRTTNSCNHSRGSSLAEDHTDYVPMTRPATDDGYVHMCRTNVCGSDDYPAGLSPGSSSSITSGTPSTDYRFLEYPLEKVSSFLTPSEEDDSSIDRPIRAYSVGSRPETLKKCSRLEIINQDPSRVRAQSFSSPMGAVHKCGIRSVPRSMAASTTPPHSHYSPHLPPVGTNSSSGKKSSSAPVLSNSSHRSDLMEMDFSKNASKKTSLSKLSSRPFLLSNPGSIPRTSEGYVDMTPKNYVDMKPGLIEESRSQRYSLSSSPKTLSSQPGPYMDMTGASGESTNSRTKPVLVPSKNVSTHSISPQSLQQAGPYLEMKPGLGVTPSPPKPVIILAGNISKPAVSEAAYVEMKAGISSIISSPANSSVSQSKVSDNSQPIGYMKMDMQSNVLKKNTASPDIASPSSKQVNSDLSSENQLMNSYISMQPSGDNNATLSFSNASSSSEGQSMTSPSEDGYMNMSFKPTRKVAVQENNIEVLSGIDISAINRSKPLDTPQSRTLQGYVEMTWNQKTTSKNNNEDYMNMSYEGSKSNATKAKEKRNLQKERYKSQPIAINQSSSNIPDSNKIPSASTSPVLSFLSGRKTSAGTSPKFYPSYLPLGANSSPSSSPFSSLRRNKNHGARRESDDANSGLNTPTGSSIIFPISINSPSSPVKPFTGSSNSDSKDDSYKSSTDVSSRNVNSELSEVSPNTPSTPDTSSSSEQPTPVNADVIESCLSSHEYVNFNPSQTTKEISEGKVVGDFGDYAVMRPMTYTGDLTRKISAPVFGMNNKKTNVMLENLPSSPSLSGHSTIIPTWDASCNTRKSSLNHPLPAASPLYKTSSKFSSQPSELSINPKVITSCHTSINKSAVTFDAQLSISNSKTGSCPSSPIVKEDINRVDRQLSTSSSGSNESSKTVTSVIDVSKSKNSGEDRAEGHKSETHSVSSEVCSENSSRPSSVSSSERELHYASLDLAPTGSEGEDSARSPRNIRTQTSVPQSSNSSPSPSPGYQGPSSGNTEVSTYAEIDFTKSEGLRSVTTSLNRMPRH